MLILSLSLLQHFVASGAKSYAYSLVKRETDAVVRFEIKMKGMKASECNLQLVRRMTFSAWLNWLTVSQSFHTFFFFFSQINFDALKAMVLSATETVITEQHFCRNYKKATIHTRYITKRFRCTYSKRSRLSDRVSTLPFGYKLNSIEELMFALDGLDMLEEGSETENSDGETED